MNSSVVTTGVSLLAIVSIFLTSCDKSDGGKTVEFEVKKPGSTEEKSEQAPSESSTEADAERSPPRNLSWTPPLPEEMEPMPTVYVPVEGFPARGASADEALVTIVEFGDYGCPDTHARVGLVQKVLDEYGDEVRFVYRNLVWVPGDYGPFAADLAQAAKASDAYWAAYDLIWEDFRNLEQKGREYYLDELELSAEDLDAHSDEAEAATKRNQKFAEEHNVQWVPTFFVNGIPAVKVSDEQFIELVELQITKAREIRDKTEQSGDKLYRAAVEANQADK